MEQSLARSAFVPWRDLLGCFTLLPLLTGLGQAHHGAILREAATLVDTGKLKPLLNEQRFSFTDVAAAHAVVESGSLGKVVVEV